MLYKPDAKTYTSPFSGKAYSESKLFWFNILRRAELHDLTPHQMREVLSISVK
jgi:hypothetical protein